MQRQFTYADVSFSPWHINPYSGGGQSLYTSSATPQQPTYKRVVLPPAPIFYHPGITQLIESSDEEDEVEAGPSDTTTDEQPLVEAPEPPPPAAPEPQAEAGDAGPLPSPEESLPSEPVPDSQPQEEPSAPIPSAVPEQSEESPCVGASVTAPSDGGENTVEDIKNEPPGTIGDDENVGGGVPPAEPLPADGGELDVASTADGDQGGVSLDTSSSIAPETIAESSAEPASSPQPELQQEAELPVPGSPKVVHFSPDVKDSDAASIGKKKKEDPKKGKASAKPKPRVNAFIRIKDTPPPAPTPPKEEKKKVEKSEKEDKKKDIKKKADKEKSSPAKEEKKKAIEKDTPPPAPAKKKLSKAEERKKKKEEKDKKSKAKKGDRKGSISSSIADEKAASENGDATSDVPGSSVGEQSSEIQSTVLEPEAVIDEAATDATSGGNAQSADETTLVEQVSESTGESSPENEVQPEPTPSSSIPEAEDSASGEALGISDNPPAESEPIEEPAISNDGPAAVSENVPIDDVPAPASQDAPVSSEDGQNLAGEEGSSSLEAIVEPTAAGCDGDGPALDSDDTPSLSGDTEPPLPTCDVEPSPSGDADPGPPTEPLLPTEPCEPPLEIQSESGVTPAPEGLGGDNSAQGSIEEEQLGSNENPSAGVDEDTRCGEEMNDGDKFESGDAKIPDTAEGSNAHSAPQESVIDASSAIQDVDQTSSMPEEESAGGELIVPADGLSAEAPALSESPAGDADNTGNAEGHDNEISEEDSNLMTEEVQESSQAIESLSVLESNAIQEELSTTCEDPAPQSCESEAFLIDETSLQESQPDPSDNMQDQGDGASSEEGNAAQSENGESGLTEEVEAQSLVSRSLPLDDDGSKNDDAAPSPALSKQDGEHREIEAETSQDLATNPVSPTASPEVSEQGGGNSVSESGEIAGTEGTNTSENLEMSCPTTESTSSESLDADVTVGETQQQASEVGVDVQDSGAFPVHNEELNSHAGPDEDAEGVNPADASPQDSPGVDNVAAGEDSSTETHGSEQNTVGDTSLLDRAQSALQDDTASLATNNSEQDPAIESTEVSADCIDVPLQPDECSQEESSNDSSNSATSATEIGEQPPTDLEETQTSGLDGSQLENADQPEDSKDIASPDSHTVDASTVHTEPDDSNSEFVPAEVPNGTDSVGDVPISGPQPPQDEVTECRDHNTAEPDDSQSAVPEVSPRSNDECAQHEQEGDIAISGNEDGHCANQNDSQNNEEAQIHDQQGSICGTPNGEILDEAQSLQDTEISEGSIDIDEIVDSSSQLANGTGDIIDDEISDPIDMPQDSHTPTLETGDETLNGIDPQVDGLKEDVEQPVEISNSESCTNAEGDSGLSPKIAQGEDQAESTTGSEDVVTEGLLGEATGLTDQDEVDLPCEAKEIDGDAEEPSATSGSDISKAETEAELQDDCNDVEMEQLPLADSQVPESEPSNLSGSGDGEANPSNVQDSDQTPLNDADSTAQPEDQNPDAIPTTRSLSLENSTIDAEQGGDVEPIQSQVDEEDSPPSVITDVDCESSSPPAEIPLEPGTTNEQGDEQISDIGKERNSPQDTEPMEVAGNLEPQEASLDEVPQEEVPLVEAVSDIEQGQGACEQEISPAEGIPDAQLDVSEPAAGLEELSLPEKQDKQEQQQESTGSGDAALIPDQSDPATEDSPEDKLPDPEPEVVEGNLPAQDVETPATKPAEDQEAVGNIEKDHVTENSVNDNEESTNEGLANETSPPDEAAKEQSADGDVESGGSGQQVERHEESQMGNEDAQPAREQESGGENTEQLSQDPTLDATQPSEPVQEAQPIQEVTIPQENEPVEQSTQESSMPQGDEPVEQPIQEVTIPQENEPVEQPTQESSTPQENEPLSQPEPESTRDIEVPNQLDGVEEPQSIPEPGLDVPTDGGNAEGSPPTGQAEQEPQSIPEPKLEIPADGGNVEESPSAGQAEQEPNPIGEGPPQIEPAENPPSIPEPELDAATAERNVGGSPPVGQPEQEPNPIPDEPPQIEPVEFSQPIPETVQDADLVNENTESVDKQEEVIQLSVVDEQPNSVVEEVVEEQAVEDEIVEQSQAEPLPVEGQAEPTFQDIKDESVAEQSKELSVDDDSRKETSDEQLDGGAAQVEESTTLLQAVAVDGGETQQLDPPAPPATPPQDTAVVDQSTTEASPASPPREKPRRRQSHSHRDGKHSSHKRRESNTSAMERPKLNGIALLAAAKLAGSARNKRRDSMTDKEPARSRDKPRETEKSSSSREREHRERSHRHRDRGDDKESKRRALEAKEEEVERRRRHEARRAERAEKERAAREEEAARLQVEEEARQKRRDERRAVRKAEEERLLAVEDERLAKEAEARRIRHEERRKRHEEKKRMEQERLGKAERDEEEAQERRRQRRAEREREKLGTSTKSKTEQSPPRDAARRAAEEDEPEPTATPSSSSPVSPRAPTRRNTNERSREAPPNPRRNSILGGLGLFGRSKTEPVVPTSKSIKPPNKVKTDPIGDAKHKTRPSSSQQSSNESRDRAERPHRSRQHSHRHRQFKSTEEEAEYRAQKERRRAARAAKEQLEMSGGRDGGISLATANDDAQPPAEAVKQIPEPAFTAEPERPPSPILDDAAAVVGASSTSSTERRRTSKRVSIMENDRPKSRRISMAEKDRPVSRRTESDRPRAPRSNEEQPRPRPRRSDTERSTRHKKKDEGGFKGFFRRIVA